MTPTLLHEIFDALFAPVVLAAVGWFYHLGSRVSVVETKHDDLVTLMNSKVDNLGEKIDTVNDRLDRLANYLTNNGRIH